jgi:DNA mismatch repair protein MutS
MTEARNQSLPQRWEKMEFHSILQIGDASEMSASVREPECFTDLNLDQIVSAILKDYAEYGLLGHFRQMPESLETVLYRQEVMRELETPFVRDSITAFSQDMRKVREYAGYGRTLHNPDQRRKWLLDAGMRYCEAVSGLDAALTSGELAVKGLTAKEPSTEESASQDPSSSGLLPSDLSSRGMLLFAAWLHSYRNSTDFMEYHMQTEALQKEAERIRYRLEMGRDRIVVGADDADTDYSEEINTTFAPLMEVPFNERIHFFADLEMSMLENRILALVKEKHQDTFLKLEQWCEKYKDYPDPVLLRFDREIQYYLSCHSFLAPLRKHGYSFSYPELSSERRLEIVEGYDLALAVKCMESGAEVIPNDCLLSGDERLMVLTGPNQGGKTTYARALGQVLFLASLGCPVPARKARVFLCDSIFTHFSVEEDIGAQSGRLQEELLRVRAILDKATEQSLVILNELFSTTTTRDAHAMGKRILDHFAALDCFCLYVTHIHELAVSSPKAVSLVAAVREGNTDVRTYRIMRRPADGQAYAHAIAAKYHLDYRGVKERVGT